MFENDQRSFGNVYIPPSSKRTCLSGGGGAPCIQPITRGSLAKASSGGGSAAVSAGMVPAAGDGADAVIRPFCASSLRRDQAPDLLQRRRVVHRRQVAGVA